MLIPNLESFKEISHANTSKNASEFRARRMLQHGRAVRWLESGAAWVVSGTVGRTADGSVRPEFARFFNVFACEVTKNDSRYGISVKNWFRK